jgi:hypothetical protein
VCIRILFVDSFNLLQIKEKKKNPWNVFFVAVAKNCGPSLRSNLRVSKNNGAGPIRVLFFMAADNGIGRLNALLDTTKPGM